MTALVDAETPLEPGAIVGEYQIEGTLGRGGFGAVYAAAHPLIGKKVAIKVLNRRFSADPEIVSRFVSEARAVNQIRHQHIIDIFSFGRLPDGRQYYVMELLAGSTLDRYLKDHGGRLTVPEAVQILRPIARALDAAHAAGIAHRDLKPENVFVARDAEGQPWPKLLDFGIAKLLSTDDRDHHTATGAPLGTPLYMSPEQCRGRDVDHRTDLYSFGVMAYQMLTGTLPFSGQDHMEIIFKQISDQPVTPTTHRPELPAGVDDAIAAMMAKDPAQRPATVTEAVAALAAATGSGSGRGADLAAATTMQAGDGQDALAPTITPSMAKMVTPVAITSPPSSTAPSQAAFQLTPPPLGGGSRRGVLLGGAALLIAGGGVLLWKLVGRTPPATVAVKASPELVPPLPDAPIAVVPESPDAAAAPADMITVTVVGPPEGTRVRGTDGVALGSAPGPIRVPRGDTPLELRFDKDGYEPASEKIRPAEDLKLTVTLKNKRGKKTRKSDEIGDFGN